MTTVTPKALFEGTALTTSNATLYTSPANTRTSIQSASFVNVSGTAAMTYLYLVESGGTANAANAAICALTIASGATYQAPELINQIMEPGDSIAARATAGTAISARASGAQIA